MNKSIVISVLGPDSPGLVKALSQIIVAHQGEWVESQMASLAGKFAGILRVNLPTEQLASFQEALRASDKLGLSAIFEETQETKREAQKVLHIELLGQDQPGIVHRISSELAKLSASVDELHTEVIEASMSGEQLFKAEMKIHIPETVSKSTIQAVLEDLANELIVDIELLDD